MEIHRRLPEAAGVLPRRRSLVASAAALGVLLATAVGVAAGDVLCVDTDGSGGCFTSLAAAMAAAGKRAEFEVAAGTYSESLPAIVHRNWTLRGAGAGATVLQVTFNAQGVATRLALADLTVEAPPGAAAVSVGFRARLEMERVEVRGGDPGLQCAASSRATIVASDVHANPGAGISGGCRLRLSRSAVHSNGAEGLRHSGGESGQSRIEDSTFSGNLGSAIVVAENSRARIRGCTLVGNGAIEGGALRLLGGSQARLEATILTDEAGGVGGLPDLRIQGSGRLRSNGFNLVKDPAVGNVPSGRTALDLVGVDPLLGPLLDNGGGTLTHAPGLGSPVLEVVISGIACRRADQRGAPRAPAPCDIGAFEAP